MGLWKGRKLVADKTQSCLRTYSVICSSGANVRDKVLNLNDYDSNFSIKNGTHFFVQFTNGHNLTATKDSNQMVTNDYPTMTVKNRNVNAVESIPIKMAGEYVGENFVKRGETLHLIYWKTSESNEFFDCVSGDTIWRNDNNIRPRNGEMVVPYAKHAYSADEANEAVNASKLNNKTENLLSVSHASDSEFSKSIRIKYMGTDAYGTIDGVEFQGSGQNHGAIFNKTIIYARKTDGVCRVLPAGTNLEWADEGWYFISRAPDAKPQ